MWNRENEHRTTSPSSSSSQWSWKSAIIIVKSERIDGIERKVVGVLESVRVLSPIVKWLVFRSCAFALAFVCECMWWPKSDPIKREQTKRKSHKTFSHNNKIFSSVSFFLLLLLSSSFSSSSFFLHFHLILLNCVLAVFLALSLNSARIHILLVSLRAAPHFFTRKTNHCPSFDRRTWIVKHFCWNSTTYQHLTWLAKERRRGYDRESEMEHYL